MRTRDKVRYLNAWEQAWKDYAFQESLWEEAIDQLQEGCTKISWYWEEKRKLLKLMKRMEKLAPKVKEAVESN